MDRSCAMSKDFFLWSHFHGPTSQKYVSKAFRPLTRCRPNMDIEKWLCHITNALWMPPMWLGARKISAVDYDLMDLKALMLPQLLVVLFPSCRAWKFSRWINSPPPSNHKTWMKFFKLSLLLIVLAMEMMPNPFWWQPSNDIKFNQWYESTCVGIWRFSEVP